VRVRPRSVRPVLLGLLLALTACGGHTDGKKLRLITWADYAPADVVAQFERETGIKVAVTLSNNEEIISKLHATDGAGFDLAQPSVDRLTGVQRDFGVYKPIDESKVKLEQFRPEILEIARKNATLDGHLYALPYIWGTDGVVANSKFARDVSDYTDVCRPDLKGRTSLRLRRPILMGFAFAMGKDPFALYDDPKAYAALMDQVGDRLAACKGNLRFFFDNKDQLLNGMRAGELVVADMWDTGGWTLNRENPDIDYVVPKSGALGWLDTFALPCRGLCLDQFHDAARHRSTHHSTRRQLDCRARYRGPGRSAHASAVLCQLPGRRLHQHPLVPGHPVRPRGDRGPHPGPRQSRAVMRPPQLR